MVASAADLGLSAHQYSNALGIIAAVKARGWSIKAAYIAVETALTESGMRMIASANVPASQKYPYVPLAWTSDGLGHDHASMGMFQQQTGYAWDPYNNGHPVSVWIATMQQSTMSTPDGWGKPAELMNAQASTAKFLNALATKPWQSMTNWQAAQAVQGSAFPDGSNYRGMDGRAQTIVNALWGSNVTPSSGPTRVLTAGKEDQVIIITAPASGTFGGGIAQLVDGGKYHLSGPEWAAIQEVRAKSPASVQLVAVTPAHYQSLAEKRGKI